MNQPPTKTNASRITELDALRGLAALSVTLYHFLNLYGKVFGRTRPLAIDFAWGTHGVWLFFMLSGYVIFMTLERCRGFLDFMIGRFSRLFPAYWAAALVTYMIVHFYGLPGQEVPVRDALWNLSMLPRFARADFIDHSYWSLEPELIFYAVMALVFVGGALKRMRSVLALWLLAAALAHGVLVFFPTDAFAYHVAGKIKAVLVLDYIHLFAIGMIFYDVRRSGRKWTPGHLALLAAALSMTFWVSPLTEALCITALAALFYAATTNRLPVLSSRPLLWLGSISYSLYLTHQSLGIIALHWFDAHGWEPHLAVLIVTAASLGFAAVLSAMVEYPAMRWLRARFRKQSPKTPPIASHAYGATA